MRYYIVNEHDPSICYGITTPKEVKEDLGISNTDFTKMIRNSVKYKNGILVEADDDDNRFITSEDDEEWRKIGESKVSDYYVSSRFRVMSKYRVSKKEKLLKIKYCGGIKTVNLRGTKSLYRLVYKAFINDAIGTNDCVVCDGAEKIENLRIGIQGKNENIKSRRVCVDGIVYNSVRECSEKIYIDISTLYRYLEGSRKNLIGIKWCEEA